MPTDKSDLDKKTRQSFRRAAFGMSSLGILIVIAAVIFAIHLISDNWADKPEVQTNSFDLVNHPKQDSYYQLAYGDTARLFIAVDKLTSDSIFFAKHSFTKQDYDSISKITPFTDEHFTKKSSRDSMSLSEFKAYIDTGKVYRVSRFH